MKKVIILILMLFFTVAAQEKKDEITGDQEKQLWEFAEGLFQRTWYKDAVKEYKAFLVKFPQSVKAQDVRWRLYESYVKLGLDKELMSILDEFIKNEKNIVRKETARMNKARLLFDAKKFDDALKIYEQINRSLKKGELWETARYEAARIFLSKGKQGEAFLRFRELSSLNYLGKSQIRAYAIFAYASLLSEKNQFAEAIKQYKRLTGTDGTPPEISENALFNTGGIFFRSGKFADAGNAFLKVISDYPDGRFRETSINQAARCYISQGKLLEASEILKKLSDSTGSVALERDYLSAYTLWQLKQYPKAVVLFDICINHDNEKYREEAWHNKINCLSEAGETRKALDEAAKFLKIYKETVWLADVNYTAGLDAEKLKDYKLAESFFRRSLETYSGEWPLIDNNFFALARVLSTQKKFAEEAEIWTELSKRKRSEFRETAMLKGADAWVKAAKPDNALDMLSTYLINFPEGSEAFYVKNRIAEIHIVNQNYDKAVVFLNQILDQKGLPLAEKASLQSVLGRVFYYQKKYNEAVEQLKSCLKIKELKPGVITDCQVYLGFCQIALDKEQEGVKTLSQAFLVREDFSALLSLKEEKAIAAMLEKYNHAKAAEKVYGRLAKAEDRKTRIAGLMGLSRLILKGGKPADGLVHLQKILELCKEEDQHERVNALSVMGELYFMQGQDDRSLQTFESALKMKSGSEMAVCRSLYGLAAILKKKGDYDKARRYANQVFILYNDPEYCPKAMFLALQTQVLSSRKKEAGQTAAELKKKFPLYFAKIEVQDYLKENGIKTD